MKNQSRKAAWAAVIVLICSIFLSAASFVSTSAGEVSEDRQNTLRSAAQLVNSVVTNTLIRPITVAKVMAEDINLQEYLQTAGEDPKSVESGIAGYLTSLRDGLGYKMMFAVCDQSGAYYTCDGISSYIDKNYEGNSEWYGVFMASGKEQDLDVDVEESAGWGLSVFANQLVRDTNGKVLGVCGTAVEMTQLQSILESYERIYQVEIQITDETGLIQIDTDTNRIETAYVTLPDAESISDGEYYYEKQGDRVIAYMEDVDMYLIVTNTQDAVSGIAAYVRTPLLISLAGVLIACGLMLLAERMKKTAIEKQ